MDVILAIIKWQYALVYIYDIIIFSKTPTELLQHIDEVVKLLISAVMTEMLENAHYLVEL